MPALVVRNLTKLFGSWRAVSDLNLEIVEGEIVTLLGPSGCGKTTTLRCISGLERITSGEIYIGDTLVSSLQVHLPSHRRHIGLVFQSYALWPHMTVEQNIRYGLEVLKVPKEETRRRVSKILEVIDLAAFGDRLPSELSGGQQQRVALGRSLVVQPRLLLLDEPLSNLDAGLRDRVRKELRSILKRVGIAALYVTHDQREALSISDRVVLMDRGQVIQIGRPEEVYEWPNSFFSAVFLGGANVLPADGIRATRNGQVGLVHGVGQVHGRGVEGEAFTTGVAMFRRERAVLTTESEGKSANQWRGRIVEKSYEGWGVEYEVSVGPLHIRVLSSVIGPSVGDSVWVQVPEAHLLFLPKT